MRKLLSTMLVLLISMALWAQKNQRSGEIQTILPKGKGLGAYGAVSLGYTQLDQKDALVTGARAGIILGEALALGIGGFGLANDINYHRMWDGNPVRYSLAGGYGGVFIEPVIGSRKAIHVSFPILVGAGGLALVENSGWRYFDHITEKDYDAFLIVEPAAELELNLTRFFRVAAFVSKRFTTRIDLYQTDSEILRGTTLGMTLKLGKF